MDKSVRRVTLVQGSGDNRVSKVVYDALEDGDEIIMRAFCERTGYARIGFGESTGVIA